jgi:hypothetical protein
MEVEVKKELFEKFENSNFRKLIVLWLYFSKKLSQILIIEYTNIPTSSINDIINSFRNEGVIEDGRGKNGSKSISNEAENEIIQA